MISFTRTGWRKAFLIGAGALACLYAVAVLVYVELIPDIGLRSAFDRKVKRFEGPCFPAGNEPTAALQEGDEITAIGARPVRTWPQLLRRLVALRDDEPQYVTSLGSKQGPAFVRLQADHPIDLDSFAASPGHARTEVIPPNALFVRVDFERPDSDGTTTGFSCWCRVGRLPFEEFFPSILWFFLKLGLFVVGALVFWKRPTNSSAMQFFLLCSVTLGAYMGGFHWSRIATQPFLILIFMVCAIMLPPVLLHFYCVFPRPKSFLLRYPTRSFALIYGLPVVFLAGMMATYWLLYGFTHEYLEGSVSDALKAILVETYIYLGVASLWYLASVACLIHSYRTAADSTERNQVKWILFGSLAALIPIGYSLGLAVLKQNEFSVGGATWYMFAASICFTTAFIISITRYRLMQLDQLLSSGVIYFVISFVAGLIYYAVFFLGTLIVGSQTGPTLVQILPVSSTALVLMFVLDLARSRFKKALDRRFYREKFQLDRTLRHMGRTIEQLVDPPTLARQLLQTSAEALSVSRASVYLREGNPPLYRLADSLGEAPPLQELSSGCPLVEALSSRGAAVASRSTATDPVQRQLRFLGGDAAQALAHEGQLLGLLVLGPKELGLYGPEDLSLLAAFSQLVALALKSAERHRTIEALNRDLRTKVEKISEQQRRILALQSQLMRQAAPAGEPATPAAPPREGIIGSSPVVLQLMQLVKKVSASQSAVLIRGESGTGKELLARALHETSPRAGKTFVKVHCAALSAGLLESELFGHVKGAFTGAHRDKVGRFELADEGTLFLDEIGDISLEVQTKLLRVLQEMTFERVGASEPLEVDVRIIAATHQDLEQLIKDGRFREDLYYRLNVISIQVPPLRERCEDIPELVQHFLRAHAQRAGKEVAQIDDDAMALLKALPWPGNIRQLENVIERAVVVAEGTSITVDDLPVELVVAAADCPAESQDESLPVLPSNGLRSAREEFGRRERERLVRALAAAHGNKAEAARALGLARSTLVSRLKKHGLS